MTLELFGMTGTKLYAVILVALLVIGSAGYMIMDSMSKPYALSGEDDDSFSIDYVDEGESYVIFTSNPSGASIEINDKTYTTPTEKIKLDPGSYSYSVSLENYATANGEASVEDGKSKTLNIVLESAPLLEPGETPTEEPTGTPTPDGTPAETPTPTATEEYDIPFMGVDVRIVAGTPFQGVKFAGAHDEAAWLDVQGKYLYLTKNNEINLKQISKYPNGVGNTLIEYDDNVPTGWNEFEHLQTWGQDIDFRLEYTGTSTTGTIGQALIGHFPAPDTPSAQVMKINIVPKHYGFWFDVQKKDDAGPIIVGNKAEPVGIYGSSWALATIASWDFRTMPVIRIDVSNSQENLDYDRTTYKLYNWAFWTPATVDQDGNWIGGEASTRVVIRGSDADNFDTVGSKELYLQLMDQERYGEEPYISIYKITYDVSCGNIDNIKVTKLE